MLKKIAVSLVTLLSITTGLTTVYADPLDPDHFKAGTWKGTYWSTNCDTSYKGSAILTVTDPVYNNSNPNLISVSFGGNLTLSGPIPAEFPDYSKGIDLLPAQTEILESAMGYSTFLTPVQGPEFTAQGSGYVPNTQEIFAAGAYSTSGCRISVDVFSAG